MPSLEGLTALGQEALVLSLAVSLPVVGIAALVGLLVAALQAATQIQDVTISHLPRLVAVALALVLVGPWMGAQIAAFAVRVLQGG
jgi:type III secretion HrpO family protein